MSDTSPRLVTWENGTDLVIELLLGRDVETVWNALTDSDSARTWFAPFRLGEDGETRTIAFALEDIDLSGSVLSCEDFDHVLLELDDFGVLGLRVMPLEGETGQETLLVFTHTASDVETARAQAAEVGPMWDTHLRLFARTLGIDIAEATEPELVATYSDLDLEIAETADGTEGEA
ncbi:SRPBCC domain-containing protein [Brevibacterium pigmentatum]|uniref:SRPBCC domain-containing protein n=1 Tax=Brevibacterium pigmentatum TaxID=1496080 RepID=UPI001422EEFB|nr:SRPBCC domain-containing protein [Brevibacterium pigmentatum]